MATSDRSKPATAAPLDLLPVIKRSGILPDRQFDEIRAKVLSGEYPNNSHALADRLVREGILTQYQTNRFLNNKSHGLLVGGRYVILDRLGSGSMGRVYKAHHLLMGREVALKIIAPEIVSNARVVARFQREMRLVGRLDDPHVVRAFDADQVDNILFIVMEYVPGQSLAQRLRSKGPLPPAEAVSYAAQAALGLSHAHEQGIVHRDIKPSNLLLTEDRQIKILDLGLGVLMEADNQVTFETADGIAVGTIDYMSPEQACGKEVDGRSDLYSLGCSMYHLMTGLLPFPGESPIERLGKRISGRPVPITDVLPNLPPRLVQAMDKLLAHKPHERYQTAGVAAEALQSLTRKRSAPRPAAPQTGPRLPVVDVAERVPAPAAEAPTPPNYPRWFAPLAALAERSPTLALVALLSAGLLLVGIGLALGAILF
ncbi:MAG TPA: serine/threonine-protein kinase [Isosphaeraceae bacterium]|jgi:serine/threonine-protein kinase|nr:serine/threonine-protein kinase [Isosphaeraceae bacterium]